MCVTISTKSSPFLLTSSVLSRGTVRVAATLPAMSDDESTNTPSLPLATGQDVHPTAVYQSPLKEWVATAASTVGALTQANPTTAAIALQKLKLRATWPPSHVLVPGPTSPDPINVH